MRQQKKWFISIITLAVISSGLLITFGYKELSLLTVINSSSIIAILLIIIGLIFFIIQGGFFRGIVYSFRRYRKVFSRRRDYEEGQETLSDYSDLPDVVKFPMTFPLIFIGISIFLIDLILSLFY